MAVSDVSIHWSRVPPGSVWRPDVPPEYEVLGVWPAPVPSDGFLTVIGETNIGERDEDWENGAAEMFDRLWSELAGLGTPILLGVPISFNGPLASLWMKLRGREEAPLTFQDEISLRLWQDNVPEAVVAFGSTGCQLRTSNGEHVYWIVVPENLSSSFSEILRRVAGVRPLIEKQLDWLQRNLPGCAER